VEKTLKPECADDNGSTFPLVSILVVNWNGRECIETCLHSCLQLSYPRYEIIVLDNDSVDGSAEIVESKFPSVRLIRNRKNEGFARACNIGIRAARGTYISILTCDAYVDSMWLSHLVREMTDSRKSGSGNTSIAAGIAYFHEPNDVICGGGGFIDLVTGWTWLPGAFGKSVRDTEDVDFVGGGAMLVKRELFERIGLFDENLFLYTEDVDLCLRARRAGYGLRVVPGARCWHMAPMEQKASIRAYYLGACSRFYVFFKHFPLRYLFSTIFFQLVVKPLSEVLLLHQPPIYLLLAIRAFGMNMLRLREALVARTGLEKLGKTKARPRFREFLTTAAGRLANTRYYRW